MFLPESLSRYIEDLGMDVPTSLNVDFVHTLQAKHVARYSFNSLAVLLGGEISLDLDAISEKIVTRRFGGYCFEHNKLTFELLSALGFDVQLKLARVLNNNFDRAAGRSHRVTLVTLDGEVYLVDTGFGGNGPSSPLRLSTQEDQNSGFERYRIVSLEGGEFDLQIIKDGEYFTLYRFDLAHYSDADCALGHFYSHQHPNAVFVNNLMVTRKTVDKTLSLLNSTFTVKSTSDEQTIKVDSPSLLLGILSEHFYIELEPVMAEHLFERFILPEWEEGATRSQG